MKFRNRIGSLSIVGGLAVAGAVGCSGVDAVANDDSVAPIQDALYLRAGWGAWPMGEVPVCFTAAAQQRNDFQQMQFRIREEFARTWGAATPAKLHFYIPSCPTTTGRIVVDVVDGQGRSSTNQINQTSADDTMFLTASHVLDSSASNGFYWTTVAHEFGHALGFLHEFERPGWVTTSGCPTSTSSGGNTLRTILDPNTIMNTGYCNLVTDLSFWDNLGAQQLYGSQGAVFAPIFNGYNATTRDNWLGTVGMGAASSPYAPSQAEGWGWAAPAPGTIGLYAYVDDTTGDHIAVGLSQSSYSTGTFRSLGLETYVYSSSQPGTVALKLYRNRVTHELLTTTVPPSVSAFALVSTEGYLFQDRPYKVLQQYFNSASTDRATVAQDSPLITYSVMGSGSYISADSVILKYQVTGTIPLDTFHSAANTDYLTSTTNPGGDYTRVETQGYVYAAQWTTVGTHPKPLNQYFSASAHDGYVSIEAAVNGTYSTQSTAGYAFTPHSF